MTFKQIKSDIVTLQREVDKLNSIKAHFQFHKASQEERDYQIEVQKQFNYYQTELIMLKAIVYRGKEPNTYTSIVTNKTYTLIDTDASHKVWSPILGQRTIKATKPTPPEAKSIFRYYSHCRKIARRDSQQGRSLFFLHSDDGRKDITFTMEHRSDKTYPHGEFSQKVKQGYLGTAIEPSYAIKIFKQGIFGSDKTEEMRIAMRAAYCARLLGRTGQTFRRKDKEYFITDWHIGKNLSNVETDELMKSSVADRIALAIDLTRQIAILH